MPVFEYQAIAGRGGTVKGTIDADNARVARHKLRQKGIFPTAIIEAGEEKKPKLDLSRYLKFESVSHESVAVATRQLSTLVGAGIPLVGALQALTEQTDSPPLRKSFVNIREQVEQGATFAKALTEYPKIFPKLFVNMVTSGEASGTLDKVLEYLAEHMERQLELRRKIGSALFYPILMLCFSVLVLIGLLALVVPSVIKIFQDQGATLPLPTQIVLFISNAFTSFWWAIIGALIGSYLGFKSYYRSTRGREKIDLIIAKSPIIGSMYSKVVSARVAGTLSTLLAGGVGLLQALDIVKSLVGNVHFVKTLEAARDGVKEGRQLGKELQRGGFFPTMLTRMVTIGEASGRLEPMLAKAGKAYENEVNASLAGLTSLIEPVMMIGLGGMVFGIVLAILLPMVDLVNLVQK